METSENHSKAKNNSNNCRSELASTTRDLDQDEMMKQLESCCPYIESEVNDLDEKIQSDKEICVPDFN